MANGQENSLSSKVPARLHARVNALPPEQRRALFSRLPVRHQMPYVQFGIWLHEQLRPGTALYNNAAAIRIRGPLDVVALAAVLQQIQDRHAPLRSRYKEDDEGDCWALVDPPGTRRLQCEILEAPGGIDAPEVETALSRHAMQPFDLEAGPMWRVLVVRFEACDHLLAITQHHMVSDGGSLGALLEDLAALYTARIAGAPNPRPPVNDYFSVVANRENNVNPNSLGFWRAQLTGVTGAGHLRSLLDSSADTERGDAGPGVVAIDVTGDAARAFRKQCIDNRASLFVGLTTVFVSILRTFAENDDLVLTTPVDIRGIEGAGVIGCFTNTVPLRIRVRLSDSLGDLLSHIAHTVMNAIEHAAVPYAQIIADIGDGERGADMPFNAIAVVDKNAPGTAVRFARLDAAPHGLPVHHIRHHLALSVGRRGEDLVANFEYGARVSRCTVVDISRRWCNILTQIAESGQPAWNATVGDIAESAATEAGDHA